MTETYNVPVFLLEDLEKVIKKLDRKGVIKYFNERKDESYVDTYTDTFGSFGKGVEIIPVDIDIDYKLGDWQEVASIEHTSAGNMIHPVNNEVIPSEYRTRCYCDHCNTSRRRKETYLFKKGNKYMQIGSSCINDFFDWDALSVLQLTYNLTNYNYDAIKYVNDDWFKGMYNNYYGGCWDTKELANRFYQLILKNGYVTHQQDSNRFDEVFNGNIKYDKKYDKEVEKLLNVVNTNWYNDESEYCHNVKIIIELGWVEKKNRAMLYSFIFSAMNYLSKLDNNGGKYLGKEGDKIEANIQSYKVLFHDEKYVGHGQWVLNITYKFVTNDGDTILWTTSKELEGNIKHITGTVKYLKEYKGEKQTILTRCKVE